MFKALMIGAAAGSILYFYLHLQNAYLLFSLLLGGLIGAVSHLHGRLTELQHELRTLRTQPEAAVPARAQAAPPKESEPETFLPEPPMVKAVESLEAEPPAPAVATMAGPSLKTGTRKMPVASNIDPVTLLFRYLSGGNPLVRIGGIVLFFGLAFLAKYASDLGLLSIEMRLLGIALTGMALIVIGWRLRERPGQYGLIVQGIGIATLYLVVFAGAKLFGIMPLTLAFVMMLMTVFFGAALALKQDSLAMMLFATAGGFLVPILTSSDSGSHILLFSYYTLLNLGIVMIAWHRSWRILNVTGFLFTFVIATAWGVLSYQSELLDTTEPFLVLFFLFYLGITILFTSKQPVELRGFIDATLVFGVPLATFAFQNALVKEIEYALSFSALFIGGLYLLLAKILWHKENMRLLSEAFLALSIVFVTLAVPYSLDGHWTAATWTLEASAIVWIGLRQKRLYARLFGMALQAVSALLFWSLSIDSVPAVPFANGIFLGALTVAFASLFTAWLYTHFAESADLRYERISAPAFLGLGILWWVMAGIRDVEPAFTVFGNGMLIYAALGAGIFSIIASWLKWDAMLRVLQGYLLLGAVCYLMLVPHLLHYHPFEGSGLLAFGAFFGLHYLLLYRHEALWKQVGVWHTAGAWMLGALLSLETAWQIAQFTTNPTYKLLGYTVVPLLLGLLILQRLSVISWPIERHGRTYRLFVLGGFALMLLVWEFSLFGFDGDSAPLPFVPLFNPLELGAVLVLAAVGYWYVKHCRELPLLEKSAAAAPLALALFAWLFISVSIGRAVHFYADVPYRFNALWHSALFQTALSIVWTAIAFGIIMFARRLSNRLYWIAGAVLLGTVIAKLFVIDLSNSGTLERIVSFIAVGVLVLLIGYLAPLPPAEKAPERNDLPV